MMSMQETYSGPDTRHTTTAHRRASYRTADRSIFTGQDYAGGLLIVMMIWGPLAAGAFFGA